jgi:hypothetical protein
VPVPVQRVLLLAGSVLCAPWPGSVVAQAADESTEAGHYEHGFEN